MLEMGSLYLPLNDSWETYKSRTNTLYEDGIMTEKDILRRNLASFSLNIE